MLCFLTFNKECSKHTTLAMLALLGLLLLGAEPSSQADLESGAEMCIKVYQGYPVHLRLTTYE